jgi:hypothetical protein
MINISHVSSERKESTHPRRLETAKVCLASGVMAALWTVRQASRITSNEETSSGQPKANIYPWPTQRQVGGRTQEGVVWRPFSVCENSRSSYLGVSGRKGESPEERRNAAGCVYSPSTPVLSRLPSYLYRVRRPDREAWEDVDSQSLATSSSRFPARSAGEQAPGQVWKVIEGVIQYERS